MLRARGRWLLSILCVGAALLIPPVQDRIDAHMDRTSVDPDILYLESPRMVKAMALGYDDLVADVYWMRAIQYYGRREEAARRRVPYKNLASLLDIVTTLDPKMVDVYRAGSVFLAEPEPLGAGKPLESLRLLEKGISLLPQEWRLRYDKGFVHYIYLKDFQQAGRTWLDASRVEGAPPWMEGFAAFSLSQGGAVEMAKELWRRQLENSTRADLKENAKNHLDSIQVDEDRWTIAFFLEKYAAARGTPAAHLEDLVRAGYFRFVPKDPSGVSYRYTPATGEIGLSPQSQVHYLAASHSYRELFMAKLARSYASTGKQD
jgi:hypothetical protein